MELQHYLEYLSMAISIISIIMLVIGVFKATWMFCNQHIQKLTGAERLRGMQHMRIELGSYILLALEVLIAADIIETIAKPDLKEIGVLMGIVIIRVSTSYFLNKEIAEMKEEDRSDAEAAKKTV